jgi:L-ascorbate metabolism protein UlaG (beta-lactamase superfamily)
MQLITRWANLKFAILPIGDNFTMGVDDAIMAAEFVDAKKVIGVHYNTFGFIKIDTNDAINSFKEHDIELVLPSIGQSIEL